MRQVRHSATILVAVAVGLFLSVEASGGSMICQFVVFGDSLSDTGNFYDASGLLEFPSTKTGKDGNPLPLGKNYVYDYTKGRFTNGTDAIPKNTAFTGVWHEQLARMLNLPVATPSIAGGFNYAYGGATTGNGMTNFGPVTIDNIGQQVDDFITRLNNPKQTPDKLKHLLLNNGLYLIEGGANDLLDAAEAKNATPARIMKAEGVAIAHLTVDIAKLATAGALNLMWADLAPLNLIPKVKNLAVNLKTALTIACQKFRTDEANAIQAIEDDFHKKLTIADLDLYTGVSNIIGNPAQYGFTNVTDPAQGLDVNPDDFLFWDKLHPTTHGHEELALLALKDFKQAGFTACGANTPEPSSVILLVSGISSVLIVLRSHRRRIKRGHP